MFDCSSAAHVLPSGPQLPLHPVLKTVVVIMPEGKGDLENHAVAVKTEIGSPHFAHVSLATASHGATLVICQVGEYKLPPGKASDICEQQNNQ